jgi:hypothetical protein
VEERTTLKVVTVLPLMGVTSLNLSEGKEELGNGYAIRERNALSTLEEFNETRMKQEFGLDLSKALYANYYLLVGTEHPFPPGQEKNLSDVWEELCKENGERIDRFLLALNLIERLWTFRPDIRLSWYENNYPVNQRLVSYRHHYPLSTFDGTPDLSEFRGAAKLTSVIDEIYSASDLRDSYPAVRIALDALRSGMFAIHTSIRYLQEAIALETLCSTDTQEVTYKVRVACSLLLASDVEGRTDLYNQLGKIYGKRSALIHGSSNKVTREELMEIEQISRRLLRRILQGDILSNYINRESQRKFLIGLQLGKEIEVSRGE